MHVTYFKAPSEFRRWLMRNHDRAGELWVGYYKKKSNKPSITYPESVDEALCFGWIDGIRKRVDERCYTVRFSPRRPKSKWSAINIKRARALAKAGRMHPSGLKVFQARDPKRSGVHAYDQKPSAPLEMFAKRFKGNKKAWAYFQSQPPWYQRTCGLWVLSAKRESTRLKRLATLIDDSEHGRTIAPLTRTKK